VSTLLDVSFIGFVLHTIGLLIYAGGVIWVTIINMLSQKSPKPHGKLFFMEIVRVVGKILTIGILLITVGGILRILPYIGYITVATAYGMTMIIKLILVGFVFVNGMYISYGLTPRLLSKTPKGPGENPTPEFISSTRSVARLSQINFLTVILIILFSVLLRAL
jgi:putative copper export protein